MVFGGKMSARTYNNDIFLYDIELNYWKIVITWNKPQLRCEHAMKVINNELIIHGGYNDNRTLNDLYINNIIDINSAGNERRNTT